MDETAQMQLEAFGSVSQPVVFVRDGKVEYANPIAITCGVLPEDEAVNYVEQSDEGDAFLLLKSARVRADMFPLSGGTLYIAAQDWAGPSVSLGTLLAIAQAMRDPLTNLFSVTSPLFASLEELEDPGVSRAMASINKSHYQLLHLMCNVADAPAAVGGDVVLKREKLELRSFLRKLFDKAEPLCKTCGCALYLTLPDRTVHIWADANRLSRAIYNLISNAIRHTPRPGEIKLMLTRTGSYAIIEVRDNGAALDRLQNTLDALASCPGGESESEPGAGFGLAIVRSTARAHGGTLVVSAKSDGTSAAISLSLRAPDRIAQELHTERARFDYTGGLRQDLIELSEVLPPDVFDSMDVN